MRRRGLWLGVLIGLVIGLGARAVPVRSNSEAPDALVQQFFKPVAWLIQKIDENYVEEADRQKLLVGAYQGMLSSLDRYCAYWPAETVQEFEADLEGQFGGLGIVIAWDAVNKVIRVEQTIAGTPAAKHGVLADDVIVQAKEESTGEVTKTEDFRSVHDAVKVLRGAPGTKVTITVFHGEGGAKEDMTLTRELIKIPGVRAVEMIDPERKIGYIYIPYFSKNMVDHLKKAIRDLEGQGTKGLILDLRLNPGGLLEVAEDCANLFMRGGVIVSVKDREGVEKVYEAPRTAPFPDVPLVLLVDRFSASGAEIVAAALRDNGRAKLVGESSFGKASVQKIIENPTIPGTAIKLTVARYYTPKGQLIEGKGVSPDVEVKLSEDETRKLARELSMKTEYPPISPERAAAIEKRAAEREKGSAKPAEAANPEEKKEEPFKDVQLARAVEVMAQMLGEKATAPAGAEAAAAAPAALK
jgi:carboxyl-terminal processing protease